MNALSALSHTHTHTHTHTWGDGVCESSISMFSDESSRNSSLWSILALNVSGSKVLISKKKKKRLYLCHVTCRVCERQIRPCWRFLQIYSGGFGKSAPPVDFFFWCEEKVKHHQTADSRGINWNFRVLSVLAGGKSEMVYLKLSCLQNA